MSTYAKNLRLSVLALFAAVACTAWSDAVNFRDWLSEKGATVADCASGEGHADGYGPEKLFDGVNAVGDSTAAKANRWLAKQHSSSPAYAAIIAPDGLFASPNDGLSIVRFRLYRYSSLSDNYAVNRAPATWTLWGTPDGVSWEILHEQSEAAAWAPTVDYIDVEIPQSKRTPYRGFKFQPLQSYGEITSGFDLTWRIGAMELELYVEESSHKSIRDAMIEAGVAVAGCVTGAGDARDQGTFGPELLFDGVKGTSATEGTRWLAGKNNLDGVHATIAIPDDMTEDGTVDYVVRGCRLWRNVNGDLGRSRAPTTWSVYGFYDGATSTNKLYAQTEPVSWGTGDLQRSVYFEFPADVLPCRQLRFVPESSNNDGNSWKAGLQEIEYFVEPETNVNLRAALAEAGIDVSSFVSGSGHADGFGPEKLFDGVKGVYETSGTRWLAAEDSFEGVSATIQIPRRQNGASVAGFGVRKIRLWRNLNSDTGLYRAPRTWVVEGTTNMVDWVEIQNQSQEVSSWSTMNYFDVYVGGSAVSTPWRSLRFRPLSSRHDQNPQLSWWVGLQEIEFFGTMIPGDGDRGLVILLK